ncbi:MAG TPA: hypothetical protein PL009_14590 [Flavipsychrobacter sp.]|nr:hypothetical protein [Flavipsychrobacter sp.]
MRAVLLILLWLSFTSFAPPAVQKLRYKIFKDKKEIGYISAIRTTQGETTTYDVETHMSIRVLINQKVEYTSKAIYQNGLLQNSIAKSFVNDKLHNTCITNWKGNHYTIKTDKNDHSLARSVAYSGAMLYFKEPPAGLIYSEMSGHDNTIRKAGIGHYILTNSKSKKQNKYWYKAGILDRAFLNHALIDIEIQRVS